MKQQFIEKRFNQSSLIIIEQANEIIEEYEQQGLILTVRQLYYQFVSRDYIPNTMRSYKRIVNIVNDARLAGLLSWEAIEDRTRNLISLPTWLRPSNIMRSVVDQYRTDKWEDQDYYVEVWIEKEALTGVIAHICNRVEVPYFACRGYVSQSELWRAARRLKNKCDAGQTVIVLHLGDLDPSGMDMTRDNNDRLGLLSEYSDITVERIALNMNQVHQYKPPPNPAKSTDSRHGKYVAEFGTSSWELDALSPTVIRDLIDANVARYRNEEVWEESLEQQETGRGKLQEALDFLEGQE